MPKNFELPTGLKSYKGFGDPRVHIKKFQSMMFFNSASDPVLFRSFLTYLDGAALLWFSKIPAGSISSFEDLARSFIDYFAASRIYVHGFDYLSTIKQGQHESLKDYMTKFAKATMEIPDLNPKVHLHTLKSGLRPGKFQETIAITKPKTLEEFREKAAGQMEIEELREARRAEKPQARREDEKHNNTSNQRDSRKPFKLTPKYDSYTQFNTKTEDIIKEILNAKIIKPPSRAGAYQDQRYIDKSKYYAFHQKFGHTTDECVIDKDLLERHTSTIPTPHYLRTLRISGTGTQPGRPRSYINLGGRSPRQESTARPRKQCRRTLLLYISENEIKHKYNAAVLRRAGQFLGGMRFYLRKHLVEDNTRRAPTLPNERCAIPSNRMSQPVSSNTIATIHSDQTEARRCFNESLKNKSANNYKDEQLKEPH
ncbi:uncharacterized protein [Arachis hypogaea]|uniref:uncharacterized protein n=1 Tax=Arachis hypogaea TaxID=3818 RepID=UPI003B217125